MIRLILIIVIIASMNACVSRGDPGRYGNGHYRDPYPHVRGCRTGTEKHHGLNGYNPRF